MRLLKALSDYDREESIKQYQILLQTKPGAYSVCEMIEKKLSPGNEARLLKALESGDIDETRDILSMNPKTKDRRFSFSDDEIDKRLDDIFV